MDLWHPRPQTFDDVIREKHSDFYNKICFDLGMPDKVDLITCNPPWIPASYVGGWDQLDMDNAIYDPKE